MLSLREAVLRSSSIHSSTHRHGTCSSRITAQEQYSAFKSQPIHFRFNCSAQTSVVPEPENGSATRSPSREEPR